MAKEEDWLEKCKSCQHHYTRQDDDYAYCRKRNGKCEYKPYKNKKSKEKNMKVRDIAYYYEHWSDSIVKCEIVSIKEIDGKEFAEVKDIGTVDMEDEIICNTYGTSTRLASILYPTVESAYKAYYDKNEELKQKYLEEITDVQDLIRFPLDHCLNGDEYTDYVAVAAYKEKARELLGINL